MSLRARLVAATCAVAVVALALAGLATYTAFARSQVHQIDDALDRSHEPIEELVAAREPNLAAAIGDVAPGLYVAVIGTDERSVTVPARSAGSAPLLADLDTLGLDDVEGRDGADRATYRVVRSTGGDDLRVRTARLSNGDTLVIGLPLGSAYESRRRLVVIELVVAGVALLVAAATGWALVRVGLRPLRRVEQTALAIAAGGDLEHEAPGADRPTEVGRLARAVNTMLGTIRGAFAEREATEQALRQSEERMRRFVADVSHELRTPLAAVRAYTELFDRGARDHPQDLDRALHGIGVESARMQELVEELLLLAHLDEGRPLRRDTVDLNEIVVAAIAAARAMSPRWPVTLRAEAVVTVPGDALRLRQVVDNLLANVRMHTPEGTPTAVTIAVEHGEAVLTVSDRGPGLSAAQAAHVFERFYRADPSRSRSSGGAGLGLAIAHALVTAHGGTIAVHTSPGAGMRVEIRLPLVEEGD